jgi:hypothetical protein
MSCENIVCLVFIFYILQISHLFNAVLDLRIWASMLRILTWLGSELILLCCCSSSFEISDLFNYISYFLNKTWGFLDCFLYKRLFVTKCFIPILYIPTLPHTCVDKMLLTACGTLHSCSLIWAGMNILEPDTPGI